MGERNRNAVRAAVLTVAGFLGFDVATDVVINEQTDLPAIAAWQGETEAEAKTSMWRSIGTSLKSAAMIAAVVVGTIFPQTPGKSNGFRPNGGGPPPIAAPFGHFDKEFRISLPESEHVRVADELTESLNRVSHDLRSLVESKLPGWIKKCFRIDSITFAHDGGNIVVRIAVSYSPISGLDDLVETAIEIIVELCEELLNEKLSAIDDELKNPDNKSGLSETVNRVVDGQVREMRESQRE